MATIDILDIQIASSAKKANDAIDNLITKLGKLANSLKIDTSGLEKIGKSLNLSGLEKSTKTIVDAFGNVLSSVDTAEKSLKKKTKKITLSLEQMEEKYKGLGKGFTLKGSVQFMQKNVDSLTNQLAKATLAKERFETSGKTNLGGYEKAVAKVIELKNQIESLNNQLETMRTASRAVNIDFETTGLTKVIKPLQEFEKELQDVQEGVKVTEEVYKGLSNIPKVYFDHNINELEASLKDLKNTYPQATKTISDFEQGLRNLKDISGKLAGEYIKVNVDTSTNDEISNVKNGFEELRIKLSQLEIPPIREDNLEKLQSALEKTEAKLDELNAKLQNEVTMGRVAENVDDKGFVKLKEQIALTEKTAEALRKKIKEVENTTKSTGKQNSIVNKLANSFKNLSNKAEKSVKPIDNMSKAFKNMARNILPILGIRELFSFGKESIENSMNYLETLNYFNKAFEQVASKADLSSFEEMGYESADAYYKSFSQRAKELTSKMTGFEISDTGKLSATGAASLGIDPTQLMNYQAMFAQMSSSMGVASETSLKLSQALTEIGADLASVRNMDFDKVWQDMASGLAGMSRTLDKYGVNIRNVNLQQKLNELGINANISALNQENKVMLRSIILLESTEYAYADLAKTINAPANQLRLLKSNFANLSRTIGNIFLPIVSKILPYINGLTIALQRLFTFIGELIGLDMDLSSLGGTGSNETADDILGDLQDNLDNASESAKELKNELLGFDEINKLSDTLDTEGAGTGIGGIDSDLLDKAFDDALSKYQETWDKAFADMENGSNIIADKIEKALEPVKKIIKDFAIGDFFSAGEDVSDLVISINEFVAKAIRKVNWTKLGEDVGKFLRGIKWEEVFLSLTDVIISAFQGMFKFAFATFDEAPLETSLTALFAGLAIWSKGFTVKSTAKVLVKVAFAIAAIDTLGTRLAKLIDDNVSKILGDQTIFEYIFQYGFEEGLQDIANAMKPSALISYIKANGGTTKIEFNITAETKEFQEKINEDVSSLEEFKTSSKDTLKNIDAEYENVLETARKYFELSQKDPSLFTEADLLNLKHYEEELTGYGINMKGSIDEVTRAWKGTNEELLKLIENQRNASKLQAYTDIIAEAQKQDITLRRDLQEAFDQFEDKDLLADLWTRFNKGQTKLSVKEIMKLAKQYGKTTDEIGNAMEAFNSLNKIYFAVSENQEYMNDLSEEYIQFQKDMGYVSSDVSNDMLNDTRDVLDGITTGIHATTDNLGALANGTEENTVKVIDAMSAAGKAVENFGERTGQVSENIAGMDFSIDVNTDEGKAKIEELDKLFNETEKSRTTDVEANTTPATNTLQQFKPEANSYLSGINAYVQLNSTGAINQAWSLRESIESALKGINIGLEVKLNAKVKDTIAAGFNAGLAVKQIAGEIRAYAAGGFPTSGLSLVGENGPELYGSFNGRPAVAANASITEGIEEAAYRGMMRALSESNGNNVNVTFEVQGDPNNMFKVIQKQANTYTMQTGRTPFLI